jgi:hypothetical protein
VAEVLGGAAEGSYEQGAAVVEEYEEMEREDERGVAKRPDLNAAASTSWMCRNGQNWHCIKLNGGSYCSASPSGDGGSAWPN